MPEKPIDESSAERVARRMERLERTGAKFLTTDLNLALTFAHIAADSDEDAEKQDRNRAHARRAYDDVSRISHGATLTDAERQQINQKLEELRTALEMLGEEFGS